MINFLGLGQAYSSDVYRCNISTTNK